MTAAVLKSHRRALALAQQATTPGCAPWSATQSKSG